MVKSPPFVFYWNMVMDVHLQFVFISKFLSSTPISTVQSVYISDNLCKSQRVPDGGGNVCA